VSEKLDPLEESALWEPRNAGVHALHMLGVAGATRQVALIDQGNAHEAKHQCNEEGTDDRPPVRGGTGEPEQEEPPPEKHLAEVVRMARIGPETRPHDRTGLPIATGEVIQLAIGRHLDDHRGPRHEQCDEIEPTEWTSPARKRRVER